MLQEDALSILKTGANVFLTGEPGAGKSHTIRQYVSYLRSCGIEPAITASTGIAATHIGGMTIHSWSGIGINKTLNRYELAEIASREKLVKRVKGATVLIIDEISMLDGRMLSLVDLVCRTIRASNQPFGGMQVVVVGDFFQLPPVAREEAPMFAFHSAAWREANFVTCYLSEQHRQSDEAFLGILAAMRSGSIDEDHHALLAQRKAPNAAQMTKLFPHNADVDRINNHELGKLTTKPVTFTMKHRGAKPLVEQIMRGCLSPEHLVLKIGAKVMFTKNNPEQAYVNGTTGDVVGFHRDSGMPEVKLRSGRTIVVEPVDWSMVVEGTPLASITQLPLRLAWAMTVHKSQGMSLDAAYIDLSGAFAYGQGYVALSRVRSLAGLFLGGLNARALEVDPEVLDADGAFRASSESAEAELGRLTNDDMQLRSDNFIRASGGKVGGGVVYEAPKMKAAKPKEKKGDRHAKTLELVVAGKKLVDVAAERGVTLGTVITHLEELKAQGKFPTENVAHIFLGDEKSLKQIHATIALLGFAKMKPIYDRLDGQYSYEALRIANLLYQPIV